jgi:hypothetical protein
VILFLIFDEAWPFPARNNYRVPRSTEGKGDIMSAKLMNLGIMIVVGVFSIIFIASVIFVFSTGHVGSPF